MNDGLIELISKSLNSIKGKCQIKDKTIAEQLQVSCSELNCLKHFQTIDKMSIKELAERLGITSGGVTKIVGQLEEHGILRRDMDPVDRRGIIVSLTSAGNDLISDLKSNTKVYYTSLFSGLSENEKEKILKGLQILNESWGNKIGTVTADHEIKISGGENC